MLMDRIQALIDGRPASRAHVEETLTEGYARALALEAERLRIERGIRAASQADGEGADALIAGLSRRLVCAQDELAELRGKLSTLRAHALR